MTFLTDNVLYRSKADSEGWWVFAVLVCGWGMHLDEAWACEFWAYHFEVGMALVRVMKVPLGRPALLVGESRFKLWLFQISRFPLMYNLESNRWLPMSLVLAAHMGDLTELLLAPSQALQEFGYESGYGSILCLPLCLSREFKKTFRKEFWSILDHR